MNYNYSPLGFLLFILFLALPIILAFLPLLIKINRYCSQVLQYLKSKILHLLSKQKQLKLDNQIISSKQNGNLKFTHLSDEVQITLDEKSQQDSKSLQTEEKEEENNLLHLLMKAFNLKTNLVELFCQGPEGKDSESLRIFDLLKIISCLIIIFYHSSNESGPEIPEETTLIFAIIYNMGQIVDVFFWISGCLNYLSLQCRFTQIFKQKNVKFCSVFFDLVWGRFVRIYAPYLLSLIYLTAVHSQIFTWQTDENVSRPPFLYERFGQDESCWKNLFMVANHKCMQFAWYMADDLFLYALFVIVLYIPFRLNQNMIETSSFKGRPLIFLFLILSLLLTQLCSYFILSENSFTFSDYFPSLYPMHTCFPMGNIKFFFFFFTISPVTRFCAFIFGAILGFAFELYSTKNLKEEIQKRIRQMPLILKIISYFVAILFVIASYCIGFFIWKWISLMTQPVQYQADLWTREQHYQYLLWWRFLLLVGLAFAILPCLLSIPIDPFRIMLKIHWPFSSLAKLTYSAYLFHIYVIESSIFLFGKRNNIPLEKLIFENYIFDVLITFGVAFCVYLLIEAPIRNLFKPNKKKKNNLTMENEKKNGNIIWKEAVRIEESQKLHKNSSKNTDFSQKEEEKQSNQPLDKKDNKIFENNIILSDKDLSTRGWRKNLKNIVKNYFFFAVFLTFSISLHLELYKELFQDTNIIRDCNFSLLQNSSNCSNNAKGDLDSIKKSRIFLDTEYGVCVSQCRDDRYLFSLHNSCVPNCPTPYLPCLPKLCCSPLCLTCNISNVDECLSCRYFSFIGSCFSECPFGTVSNSKNECIFCNETVTPYYDVKTSQCKIACEAQEVLYTQENHCLEKCPEGMQKSISGNHCCDENCLDCSPTNSKECTECSDKTPFLDGRSKICVTDCVGSTDINKKICYYCTNTSWFFDLSTKNCVETCPKESNTFVSRKVCLEDCSSFDPTMWGTKNKLCCKIGCQECSFEDENFCTTCSNDYFFFLDTNKCVFNCPLYHTYIVPNKTCALCKQGTEICDLKNTSKWCKPNYLLNFDYSDSTCKAYCSSGTPDPLNQFCCNENDARCENNQTGICRRLRLEKIYSPNMQKDLPFLIMLPQKWDQYKNETFPVILIFHPNSNNYLKFFVLNFGCYNEDFLIVSPDGDYNTYYADSPIDPRIRLETFITTELRSFLILNYRARNDRKWAIMGHSAGAFGAIAVAMKHRDKFCAASGFSPPFIIYDVPFIHDNYMEFRFGNKTTEKNNYIPFNMTWIAEKTELKNNQLNIIYSSYNNDSITNLTQNSRAFHHYLELKNISHTFDELIGNKHGEGWERETINIFFPFLLDAFRNNCD